LEKECYASHPQADGDPHNSLLVTPDGDAVDRYEHIFRRDGRSLYEWTGHTCEEEVRAKQRQRPDR
jgi:hypothetical protein